MANPSAVVALLLLGTACLTAAFDVPCAEKLIGGECQFDEQCFGAATVCVDGKCACPQGFDTATVNDGLVCRPAPDFVGARCETACTSPLLCVSGKCACDGGTVVGGKCTGVCKSGEQVLGTSCQRVAKLSDACSTDDECRAPYSYCKRSGSLRRCACVDGASFAVATVDGRRTRVCQPKCPGGAKVGAVCRRLYVNDVDMLVHHAATDTCSGAQYCMTYGKEVGHCCPFTCPMGAPAPGGKCERKPSKGTECDLATHYCHTVGGPGSSKSLCCPRPCAEPTPVYHEGECHAEAHRGGMCDFDAQCEGGATMRCLRGSCQCRPGYSVALGGRYPSCVKTCAGKALVGDQCLSTVGLAERCFADAQCPLNARCYMGYCECGCGFALETVLGKETCVVPGTSAATSEFLTSAVGSLFKGQSSGLQGLLSGSGLTG